MQITLEIMRSKDSDQNTEVSRLLDASHLLAEMSTILNEKNSAYEKIAHQLKSETQKFTEEKQTLLAELSKTSHELLKLKELHAETIKNIQSSINSEKTRNEELVLRTTEYRIENEKLKKDVLGLSETHRRSTELAAQLSEKTAEYDRICEERRTDSYKFTQERQKLITENSKLHREFLELETRSADTLRNLQRTLRDEHTRCLELESRITTFRSENEKLKTDISSIYEDRKNLEERNIRFTQQLTEFKRRNAEEIRSLEQAIADEQLRSSELRSRIEILTRENDRLRNQREQYLERAHQILLEKQELTEEILNLRHTPLKKKKREEPIQIQNTEKQSGQNLFKQVNAEVQKRISSGISKEIPEEVCQAIDQLNKIKPIQDLMVLKTRELEELRRKIEPLSGSDPNRKALFELLKERSEQLEKLKKVLHETEAGKDNVYLFKPHIEKISLC